MTWVIEGQCNRCGECCGPPVITDGPTIAPGESKCRFYDAEQGCLIMARTGKIENAKDSRGRKITDRQIKWFLANCPDYPFYCIDDLVEGRHSLIDGCTYKLVEK